MKIYKYYQYAAMTSLNASIVALIPPFIFVCFGVVLKQNHSMLLFTLPFILYSFISYQIFLLNKNRIVDSTKQESDRNIEEEAVDNTFAIQFLPAPSLRMLLFKQDGQLSGEINDMSTNKFRWFLPYFIDQFYTKSYSFTNPNGEVVFTFVKKEKNILVKNDRNKLVALVRRKSSKKYKIETKVGEKEVIIQSSPFFTDVRFYNSNGLLLARVRKGYLPRTWDKHIKDPNTPMLTFHDQLLELEKVALLALLSKLYRYRNH